MTTEKAPFAIEIRKPPENVELIVGVRKDGEVEYGEGVVPSEAALKFWNSIAGFARIHGIAFKPYLATYREGKKRRDCMVLAEFWPQLGPAKARRQQCVIELAEPRGATRIVDRAYISSYISR